MAIIASVEDRLQPVWLNAEGFIPGGEAECLALTAKVVAER